MKVRSVEYRTLRTEVGESVIPASGKANRMPPLVFASVITEDGVEGNYISYCIPTGTIGHGVELAREILVGRDSYDVGAISQEMMRVLPPNSHPQALAAADVCLWDINAKAVDLPLYKYLGACRDRIRGYASTVPYPTVDGYLKVISDAVAQGYTAAKVHPFRDAKRDVELVRALRSEFPDIDLMIDPVCAYNLPDALEVGYALDELGYFWYENPISDYDLDGLAHLSSKLRTPLAVGEQNYVGFPALRDYLKSGIGFYVRSLGEYAGGLSHVLKSAHAAEAFGVNYEIHSYGPPLNLAMYVNVALSVPNCEFAEIIVPETLLSMGMADVPRVDEDGYLEAPKHPGLGYRVDRDAIENLTLEVF
ncbi:mandelate racemase/muconate lactonizing enzyme family protein [Kitasatospora sp. NPDC052896]|uniref:mandelate racemase/muconate lactonizing enzyme family protein n=1 Tax=Kitasatospora sp. NPDC052896 TaxID=3364061 RepID=UPI0037C84342